MLSLSLGSVSLLYEVWTIFKRSQVPFYDSASCMVKGRPWFSKWHWRERCEGDCCFIDTRIVSSGCSFSTVTNRFFFRVNFLCKLNSWFVAIHHVQVFPTQTKHLLAITVRQHDIFKLKAYIINSKVMKQKSIKDLCKYKNVNRIILDKNK